MMRSERSTAARRCAVVSTVASSKSRAITACSFLSVAWLIDAVASSITTMRTFVNNALADAKALTVSAQFPRQLELQRADLGLHLHLLERSPDLRVRVLVERVHIRSGRGRLVDDEERAEGRVSKEVFLKYFKTTGGLGMCAMVLLVQVFWQGFQIGSDLWLSHWTGQKQEAYSETETKRNMTIYALLGAGSVFMVLARAVTISFLELRASRTLFDSMTASLLHAPLRFFDANPIGRIVNRYSDDVVSVDFRLPIAFGSLVAYLFFTVCQLATAVYTVNFLGVLIV